MMKTEEEIKLEINDIDRAIAENKAFLRDEVEFRCDEDMIMDDTYELRLRKKMLEWVLN